MFFILVWEVLEMNNLIENDHSKNGVTYDDRLKGTLLSVLLIGASILLTWIIVFYYYIVTV